MFRNNEEEKNEKMTQMTQLFRSSSRCGSANDARTCRDDTMLPSPPPRLPTSRNERRAYSLHEDQYRGAPSPDNSSDDNENECFPQMIASFDFIASEDLEVRVTICRQIIVYLQNV